MKFYQFAWNNLKRSKARTILTILSVAVAAITLCMVLFMDKGYRTAVDEELVKKTGVHLYITREGCPMEAASIIAQGGISPFYVPQEIVDKIKEMEFVETIMPFSIFAVTTQDGARTDIFFGMTEAIQKIRPDWEISKGSWFKDKNNVILGAEMARLEKREIGDKVYFEQFDKEFVVSGILKRNYSQDDGIFFLPLEVSQDLIDRKGKLSAIALRLKDITYLEKAKSLIISALPSDYFVITSKELGEGVLRFFGSTRAIMFIMVIVAFLISVFSITNTMLMAIIERKKELAYLKCVGAGFFDIVWLISLETLILCLTGTFLGSGASLISAPHFEGFMRKFLIVYVPAAKIVRPSLEIIIAVSFITILTGALSALYPAIKAAKTMPMEVLRND